MDGLGFHAIALKLTRQAARADFGIGKDNDLAEPARLDQMHDSRALVAAWHGIRYLGHVFGRGIARGHFDLDRIVQETTAELADFIAEGCRKQQEIGRAHVCTPVTNAHLVCRLLLEKKQTATLTMQYE